jgi:hypothetical protein
MISRVHTPAFKQASLVGAAVKLLDAIKLIAAVSVDSCDTIPCGAVCITSTVEGTPQIEVLAAARVG